MLERIGRYRLLEQIGTGGQGRVYRAEDTELRRIVAVKVMNQTASAEPQYIEAIRREAQVSASLDHPHIATVFDSGIENDLAYIVMEFVPDSLDKHLASGEPLPVERVAEIALQTIGALSYLHSSGFVHRDVKPPNILLTENGTVKLTDFGLARAMESSSTASVVGTFFYMPPEQWQGIIVDHRADIYSLGITLYQMFSGHVPFEGSIGDLFRMHVQEPVPPMPAHLGISNELESVVRRALAKDREDRFQNIGEMADAIRDALARPTRPSAAAEPETAAPPPISGRSPARPMRISRKLSRIWIGAGAIVLAGVVGLVIALSG